ncbi:MAG: citrate/2-methylcitrate synthase [Oscillospiraceae bacterium]|jgi:citrate synthase|nr:citrate/2-methylcitrate synthase [Oscillospiraceae bacterium]
MTTTELELTMPATKEERVQELATLCAEKNSIDPALYPAFDVQRGLRDKDGNGVKAGLTKISTIISSKTVDGQKRSCPGVLRYRGIDIKDFTAGFLGSARYGFEEAAYLLLFGDLPTQTQLEDFQSLLAEMRWLPTNFVRDVIMKAPRQDMMNVLSRSVLTLAAYDRQCDDISVPNVLRQSLQLIGLFPLLAIYGYHCYNHYECDDSLYIHKADPALSCAENCLRLLRPDKNYTALEAKILDLCLVLHMEHGGGNNSTFTTHVVSSSGTDTYSVIASALGSLKGPKHGGANIKVVQMFEDLKRHVRDTKDEDAVARYLEQLLDKQAFDGKGLIYGMGHAVYSLSDPRADIFKSFTEQLASEKHCGEEFALYALVERLAPQIIAQRRRIYKGVSANVDFYSGFVYRILGIPQELFTPMFAIARIVGWSAHRLEELINQDKIIRPAYQSVIEPRGYLPMAER